VGGNREMITCQDVWTLITDFLEGALRPRPRELMQEHFLECEDCVLYLAQMRLSVELLGRIDDQPLAAETRDRLVELFRRSHAS
jgi:predicted anti-sigma-YlaC factor YlaD